MEQPGSEQPKEGAPMEIGGGSRQSKKTKTIPIEFLDADKGCLKRELKILELKIAELDEKAPGTPRHFRLLQLYLDKQISFKRTLQPSPAQNEVVTYEMT